MSLAAVALRRKRRLQRDSIHQSTLGNTQLYVSEGSIFLHLPLNDPEQSLSASTFKEQPEREPELHALSERSIKVLRQWQRCVGGRKSLSAPQQVTERWFAIKKQYVNSLCWLSNSLSAKGASKTQAFTYACLQCFTISHFFGGDLRSALAAFFCFCHGRKSPHLSLIRRIGPGHCFG